MGSRALAGQVVAPKVTTADELRVAVEMANAQTHVEGRDFSTANGVTAALVAALRSALPYIHHNGPHHPTKCDASCPVAIARAAIAMAGDQ